LRRRHAQPRQQKPIHQLRNLRPGLDVVASHFCDKGDCPCSECVRHAHELVCDFLGTLPAGHYTAAEIIDAVKVAAHD